MSDALNQAIRDAALAMLIKFNNRLSKNQTEPEAKLADWADYLALERKFTVGQIAHALNTLMQQNRTFMPSAYEIADVLTPKQQSSEDLGNEIASEIIQATVDKGFYKLSEVYDSLSENAKAALGQNTYLLREICNSDESALPSIRAQIRGLAKAGVQSHRSLAHNENLKRIGIETNGALPGPQKIAFLNYSAKEEA